MTGVKEAEVKFNSGKVQVEYEDTQVQPEDIAMLITKLGYQVLSYK